MSLWTNKEHRTVFDVAEDLAYSPAYSPWTKWFTGCFVAGALAFYAIYSWCDGSMTLPGKNSAPIVGEDANILVTAYLALAAFIHFHCFWSLQERLEPYAQRLKMLAILILLPCFCLVLWRQLE